MDKVLGVDVGATGIKGGIVDLNTGELLTERLKLLTPHPATPSAMAATFKELITMHKWEGPVGVGFPAIVKQGTALSAANISKEWIGTSIEQCFGDTIGQPVYAVNDADAAGIAEINFGKAENKNGVVLLLTLGSGIGSALFLDGKLLGNSELGHLKFKGDIAEAYTSNNARKRLNLEWDEFGRRLNEYLHYINRVMNPDKIILGGGISKKFDLYAPHFDVTSAVEPAVFKNAAGTIGAAWYAKERMAG